MINVMLQSDGDLDDVEEVIKQNARVKGLLVGHLQYVENIRFDGLNPVVRIRGYGLDGC